MFGGKVLKTDESMDVYQLLGARTCMGYPKVYADGAPLDNSDSMQRL